LYTKIIWVVTVVVLSALQQVTDCVLWSMWHHDLWSSNAYC